MSQVATKRKIKFTKDVVTVKAHFHEQGSVLRGDAEGFSDGFEVEIELESEAEVGEIAELVRLARALCFTEVTVANAVPIAVSARLNGQALEG